MNWMEKVKKLCELRKNDIFIDVRFRKNLWTPDEITALQQNFSFLPETYSDFIKKYDSIGIGFVSFYGSKESKIISINTKIQEFSNLLKHNCFPFGKDADGSVFLFNTKGQVLLWDKYDYDFEESPQLLAETFEEFIDDCLLGKRLGEFVNPIKNNFYKSLKKLGWA